MNLRWVICAALAFGPHAIAAEPPFAAARKAGFDAVDARNAGDQKEFLAQMEKAVSLRADVPRLLLNLAIAQVSNERPDAAIESLKKLAALGVTQPIDREPGLASLRERADFKAVVAAIAANGASVGDHDVAFSVPEMTGLIEGIAWRAKTGEFFFSDVHNRVVWARAKDGKVRKFTEFDPQIASPFALAVDEPDGSLWATISEATPMTGFDPKAEPDKMLPSGLAEFDLETGKLKRFIPVPEPGRKHGLGDLVIDADGAIYLSDTAMPVIWRLPSRGAAIERFAEDADLFYSAQGLAFSADGSSLYVADYMNGLLRIDTATRKVSAVPPSSATTTLIGIDGLVRAPNGNLLAVQNGARPYRVLRLVPSADGGAIERIEALESGHLLMSEPSLGALAADGFYVVGASGWTRFDVAAPKPTAPRPVPIFRIKLPK